MDEKDLSILYRPQIDIERNYRSDGVIRHELPSNVPEESREPVVPENPDEITSAIQNSYEAGSKLLRARRITEVLPTRAKKTTDDLLDTVLIWIGITIERLEKLKEEEPASDERHEIPGNESYGPDKTYKSESDAADTEDVVDDWPIMTSSGFVFDVIKNKDYYDLAYEQYLLDSSAIQEDFAEEYNNVLEGYVYQLVSTMEEIGLDMPEYLNYEYEGDTVTGVPANYMHLNDIIVKNQDIVNEYEDIFRKTHDLYTTDAALTAYDIASQKRVRYLKENYKTGTVGGFIEMYDKNYLADSRGRMERIYVDARTNVYKLLHSACQLTKEMLDTQLMLAISKCSLLSKEVNIFAKKDYENIDEKKDTSQDKTDDKKEENANKDNKAVKDTTKPEKKNNVDISKLMVGGGIGGAIKNSAKSVQQKTKEAAAGILNSKE